MQELLTRLRGVEPYQNGYRACCPAHEDSEPSMSVREGDDGRILVRCYKGCDFPAIAYSMGLTQSFFMPPSEVGVERDASGQPRKKRDRGKLVATYDYQDERGELLYQVERWEKLVDGEKVKDFPVRRPKEGGGWTYNLGETQRVLYRLPQLLAADRDAPILIVEGEKHVDALANLGFVATCNPGGAAAGKSRGKWRPKFSEQLAGRRVIILPDNDDPGRGHAENVAESLAGIGVGARVLDLPGLGEKDDVIDWLARGGTADELRALIANAVPYHEWREQLEADNMSGEQRLIAQFRPDHVTNAIIRSREEGNIALPSEKITELAFGLTENWPRLCGDVLFIHDTRAGREPVAWIRDDAQLFAWLSQRTGRNVEVASGRGFETRRQMLCAFQRDATRYRHIEHFPHNPPVEGIYYTCDFPEVEKYEPDGEPIDYRPQGRLGELLARFHPASDADASMILAMFLTAFWGGPPGARPLFLITSSDGRGAGKTTVAEVLAELIGGYVKAADFSQPGINQLATQLLSEEGMRKRMILIDNVKSRKFSSDSLEAMVTSTQISGRRLYIGEGQRPNYLSWVMTFNGASLSTDMASRSQVIEVSKPPDRDFSRGPEILDFARQHRDEIIAEIWRHFALPAAAVLPGSRWGKWEREILGRVPNPEVVIAAQKKHREDTDTDAEEAEEIDQMFANKLRDLGYQTHRDCVFIPSLIARNWIREALGDQFVTTSKSSQTLKQMSRERQTKFLRYHRFDWGRGFMWVPAYLSELSVDRIREDGELIHMDLADRVRRDGFQ